MQVITKDFQILEGENKFDFPAGVNLVVGPNASGKSSLFYAIENCLSNPGGVSDCINFNHDKAEVTIKDNNEEVTWIRTSDSSTYEKTAKQYLKASKLDSRDIADLGFYFDKKGNVVNIHNEWSVLFPFAESDTDMFRLFEDIFNISCSFQVIDEMKRDEQQIKATIVQAQKQKASLLEKKDTLSKIKENVKLDDIEYHLNSLSSLSQKASELEEAFNTYAKSALLRTISLPEIFDVSELYDSYHDYETIQNDYNNYQQIKKKIDIQIPKFEIDLDFEPPKELRDHYEQYCVNKSTINSYEEEIVQLINRQKQINEEINKIKVCPTCGRPL